MKMNTNVFVGLFLCLMLGFVGQNLHAQNLTIEGIANIGNNGDNSIINFNAANSKSGFIFLEDDGETAFNFDLGLGSKFTIGSSKIIAGSNMGILYSNPQYPLDFGFSAGKKLALYQDNTGEDFYGLGISGGTLDFFAGAASTSTTPLMVLTNAQRVGIGTTTPGTTLDIGAPNQQLRLTDSDDSKFWQMSASGGGMAFRYQEGEVDEELGMWLDVLGDVGIGLTNPDAKLHINGNLRVDSGEFQSGGPIVFQPDTDASGDDFISFRDNTSSETMRINSSGNVSIGSTGFSNVKLNVVTTNSNDFAAIFENDSGFETLQLTNSSGGLAINVINGRAAKPGGGTWEVGSDKRLKTDISSYQEGLDVLRKVNTVWFRYNGKEKMPTKEKYVGVIAQEVQDIAPHMVKSRSGEDISEYLMVDPSAFTYMLINAVQELDEVVAEKEELIEKQAAQMKTLEARLARLEALLGNTTELPNTTTTLTSVTLDQNIPNPFTEATNINYFIPEGTKNASLQVMDQNGRIIKTIPIQATGEGQVTLQAHLLSAGMYSYALMLDGRVMATKQMVLTK